MRHPSTLFIATSMDKLEIPPEILQRVGESLCTRSLAASVRVCKSWNAALIPILYKSLGFPLQHPNADVVARHAHHIRRLNFRSEVDRSHLDSYSMEANRSHLVSYSTTPECSNLRELDLFFRTGCSSDDRLSAVVLIMLNRNLKKLSLQQQDPYPSYRLFWTHALSHCSSSLQKLSLVNANLKAKDTNLLLSLAPTLQVLEIEEGISSWSGSFTANPQFPQLKKLVLKNALPTVSQDLEWIKQCPNLQILDWTSTSGLEGSGRAAFKSLGDHRWQNLQQIEIWGNTVLTDGDIALLLASCGALKGLWICGSNFWYQSLSALERHFGTLENVEIRSNDGIRSWVCQWIMSSCPNLKMMSCDSFSAYKLVKRDGSMDANEHVQASTQDLQRLQTEVEGGASAEVLFALLARFATVRVSAFTRPWVCLELEHLKANFVLPARSKNNYDQAVFRFLSKLTKLKSLDLDCKLFARLDSKERGLRFDLRSGLGALAPLKDLEELLLKNVKQNMEREDVQWILDQWPKLKKLTTDFNIQKNKSRELRSMTEGRGINIDSGDDDSSSEDEDEDEEDSEENYRKQLWAQFQLDV